MLVVIGPDYTGSNKSNYFTITTTVIYIGESVMNVHEISKSTQISGAWHISLHYLKWNYYFTKRGEFESRSGRGVQHYVIKFVSDLRQVGGLFRIPPPIKLITTL
jgi:hypothetical protein